MAFHFIVTCVSQKTSKKSHSILDDHIKQGSLDSVFKQWQDTLSQSSLKQKEATKLYKGGLWGALLDCWGIVNGRMPEANLWVLSAGHGLIKGDERIVPYDITFQDPCDEVPSILSKVSYEQEPDARKRILQGWWKKLIKSKNHSSGSLESLLSGLGKQDYALVVLGKDYLDAVYKDLKSGISKSDYPENIAIISNSVNDSVAKRLQPNWLYADSRFINLPKTNSTFMNAKIAHTLLVQMFENSKGISWWSIDNFNDYLKSVAANLAAPVKHDRTPTTDMEVRQYIEESLQKQDTPFSRLHRAYRDSGRACEYNRFKSLYKTVKVDLAGDSIKQRPTLPVRHTKRKSDMLFFLPDWDDRVDPLYDFENDEHFPNRDPYAHDAYHYELYGHLNCDGLLVSKSVIEQNKSKFKKIKKHGIHKYLRVPKSVPILADCGAFNYIMQENPPYETNEIIGFYQDLGFDYGVSIDHLIVPGILKREKYSQLTSSGWQDISVEEYQTLESQGNIKIVSSRGSAVQKSFLEDKVTISKETVIDVKERQRRYYLTINNAKEFIKLHKKEKATFTPIGAVQGWSPESYTDAVRQYQKMGYDYIALGGLVRSSTEEIIEILNAVIKVKKPTTRIHLFGVARLDVIKQFQNLGVSSVDSAGMLRQAWLSSTSNYHWPNGEHYTAIRVPPADKGSKANKVIASGAFSRNELISVEKKTLLILQQYARGEATLQKTYDAAMKYQLIMEGNDKLADAYMRTLIDKPWEKCHCTMCKAVGIDILLFRRNNRNRRRGFHNTYVFFEQFKKTLRS